MTENQQKELSLADVEWLDDRASSNFCAILNNQSLMNAFKDGSPNGFQNNVSGPMMADKAYELAEMLHAARKRRYPKFNGSSK
jgi:hypothetical protein